MQFMLHCFRIFFEKQIKYNKYEVGIKLLYTTEVKWTSWKKWKLSYGKKVTSRRKVKQEKSWISGLKNIFKVTEFKRKQKTIKVVKSAKGKK